MSAAPPAPDLGVDVARAAAARDRSFLLRALARGVVVLANPVTDGPPGRPTFGRIDLTALPLPVADTPDGPLLLVFSAHAALQRWYGTEQAGWVQVPAGRLARHHAGSALRWWLDAADRGNVVLEPADVAVVAALAEGRPVPEAFEAGPAARVVLDPPTDRVRALAPVVEAAATPPVRQVVACPARFDEPGSRTWVQVGVDLDAGADPGPVMAGLVHALEAATDEPVLLTRLGDGPVDAGLRRLGAELLAAGRR